MNETEISVVIPVFNSGTLLSRLYERISEALVSFRYEIIFVNDGSRDNGWDVLSGLASAHPEITAIDLVKNSGQDNAILAGLRHVNGNFVVIMDDDLQHAPEDIPALYNKCLEGFDVCYAGFRNKKHNLVKRLGSRVTSCIARTLLKKPAHIYLSPFKIIRRNIADEAARFSGPFPYIDGILLTITENFAQITVEHHPRTEGKGNYNFYRSAAVLFKLFSGFSVVPLRLMVVFGLLISLAGTGMIINYLYEFFILKNYVEGWTTIVILIIFFGGVIIMLLGLIGEYIGRIYLTLNNKPQYTIRKIVSIEENKKNKSE